MPQVIVRLRPGSHYGRFCQLSVKEGTLSVITPRFLMRVVFHKFLKFWKFCRNFRDTEVYGGADRFWKNKNKKQKTQLPELSRPFIWPRYDLQLNCWCFPFSMYRFPLYHAPGSFPMQNFPHFHPTLAEPIKQDPGEFCLIDPIVQQVWFATAIAWPTLGQLKVGEKKMIDSWAEKQKTQYNKWPQEEWRAVVSLWIGLL